jgi:RNA polymerase sigma-70 factor, ECF subfamily
VVKPEQLNDDELLTLLSKDDEAALEVIFKRYYAFVCKAVFNLLNDAETAEDIAQEVFLEIWKRRKSLAISTSFRAYLRRSAVNRTLNHIRDNKKMQEGELSDYAYQLKAPDEPGMESEEFRKMIQQAVAQLPERCRQVFVLSREDEMSYKEIAQNLDISVKTVENQIVKALRLLREYLGPFIDRALLIAIMWIINL